MKKSESRACDIMSISSASFSVIELNIYHLHASFEITLQSKSLSSTYFSYVSLIPPTFSPVIPTNFQEGIAYDSLQERYLLKRTLGARSFLVGFCNYH